MMTDYANDGTKNGMVQFRLTNLGIPYDEPQVNAVRSTYRSRGSPPGRRYIRGASRARQKHRSGYVGMAGRTRRVVTASWDNTARLWDAATGTEIAVLKAHEEWVWSAAFSPDGRRVVTASWDNTARLWDAATGTEIAVLKAHEEWVGSAAFSGHVRDEKSFAGRMPGGAVRGEAAAADQAMDVRVLAPTPTIP